MSFPADSSTLKGKQALLEWCRLHTQGYPGVNVRNMKASWKDGLALCALIHHFRPDLIYFDSLNQEDIVKNNELAFQVAEKELGIPSLLDVNDLVEMEEPEELSIVTYVSLYYHHFKDQRTKQARPRRSLFEILMDENAGTFRRRKLRNRNKTRSRENSECDANSSLESHDEQAENGSFLNEKTSEAEQ